MYASDSKFKLVGYIDSDFDGNIDDKKKTSRYVFSFGSGAFSWASMKQSIMTLSSAKVEYVVTTITTCQNMWMRIILKELLHEQKEPTQFFL